VPFSPPGSPSTPSPRRRGAGGKKKKPDPDLAFDFGGDADPADEVAVGYLAETLGEFGGVSASDVDLSRSGIEAAEARSFAGENVASGRFEEGVTTGIDALFGEGAAADLGFGDGAGGDFADGEGGGFSWTDEL
jgi:hypothetical protein